MFCADSIGKSFGNRTVLVSASAWAHAGAISVLLGRNGCGKSTLLRIACGFSAADHGTVRFLDKVYVRPRYFSLARRGLFFLPDRDLLPAHRRLGNCFDVVRWYGDGAPVDGIIDQLGLTHLLGKRVRELSGGETRRAEIGVALARRPICLVADEPFSGISPKDAGEIGDVFVAMARAGCAVLITGHEVSHLMRIADDVTWMVAGSTVGIGDPLDARMHPQFQREYMNVPM